MDQFVLYELIVAAFSVAAMIVTLYVAQSFKLRQWKFALYYLVSGLGIFTVYQLVLGFHLIESEIIHAGFEVLFIVVMTFSIYKLKETAEAIGA